MTAARWSDDIVIVAGKQWIRLAGDRREWRVREKTCSQRWMDVG